MGNFLAAKSYPFSFKQRTFSLQTDLLTIHSNFPSNFISTSKYSLISFLPFSIFFQFQRYANIYFLLIAIIQSIPAISPLNPFSSWAPLLFVLTVSLIREGIEDLYRHKSDQEVNAMRCQIYDKTTQKFVDKSWGDILVSDLLLLRNNEMIPADIIILSCEKENGQCFIETVSLDGEKALKPKISVLETMSDYPSEGGAYNLAVEITCQAPDPALHVFEGSLMTGDRNLFLGVKQLILRGAVLRNTKWMVGVVVYTGVDSKIMKNASVPRNKQSNIERLLNNFLFYILILEVVVCLISAILCGVWASNNQPFYLVQENSSSMEGFMNFFTYLILNSTMIPISLIVSLELVKLSQGYFISVDEDLYSNKRSKYAKVSTTSINEELGQIQYIFTDKTGTLTCNEMRFKYCVVGNEIYGGAIEVPDKIPKAQKNSKKANDPILDYRKWFKERSQINDMNDKLNGEQFDDSQISQILKREQSTPTNQPLLEISEENVQSDLVNEFLMILALCHECVVEVNEKSGEVEYQGPSPDEIALVGFAKKMGYTYQGISKKTLKLLINEEVKEFELLHSFEFNSDRKRMSLVIRSEGLIKLYIKGADNVIKERLDTKKSQPFLKRIEDCLDDFSKQGLRTLCIAFRVISEKEYHSFYEKYEALLNVENREKKIFDLVNDTLENNLLLLGATIVEDRLQDQVPQVLHDFLKAKIKVWMLTGDKLETAENIGKSCSLIQPDFSILRLNFPASTPFEEIKAHLTENYEIAHLNASVNKKKALLIEGGPIASIFSNEILKDIFLDLIEKCDTVICCRMTPKQKAEVVKLVKDYLGKITLAVGDGANDVNMIQEAHIGIGIFGLEGMRAVQVSDFAIGEFKLLWKLVLVQGRWCYLRISEMILYFFYKNMVFTVIQFYFSFLCAYSGQSVYDDSYIVFFNLIFTSLPLMVRAIMEKDLYYKVRAGKYEQGENQYLKEIQILKKLYPKFYYKGQQNKLFNRVRYFNWVTQGLTHGAIIFGFCCIIFYYNVLNIEGYNNDLWLFSIFLYSCLIMVVDIKLTSYTQSWTILFIVTLVLTSVIFYFSYIFIASEISSLQVYQTSLMLYRSPSFYFMMFITVGIVFLIDLLVIYIKQNYKSGNVEKGRMLMKQKYHWEEPKVEEMFESTKFKKKEDGVSAVTESDPLKQES